ncbi:MAG: hypothetical protein ACXW1U_18640, partial [Methylobacter sp.]
MTETRIWGIVVKPKTPRPRGLIRPRLCKNATSRSKMHLRPSQPGVQMKRFIQSADRSQGILFPEHLE